MKAFLRLILLIVVALVFIAGIAGFVPYLSTILGTDRPKDLGQQITLEDSLAAQEKTGVQLVKLPSDTPIGNSFILEGSRPIELTFTSKEATGIINNRPWKYYPFSDLQLRINPDGTIETSGVVNMDLFMSYANSLGYSTEDINKVMEQYHIPKMNMPFYLKGSGSIIDDRVDIHVQSLHAGQIPVPQSILVANTERINEFTQDCVARLNGFSAKKLAVENEKIVFDGTLPEKESVVYK